MTTLERHKTALIYLAVTVGLCLAWAVPASAGSLVQTQPSEYEVQPACAPPSFGHAGCLALRLVHRSASNSSAAFERAGSSSTGVSPLAAPSPAHGEVGYTPEDLHTAYELPANAPSSQTIALVDAYNDPTAAADLKAYSEELGLPECATGCFTQYNENGETTNLPFPKTTAELESWRAGGKSKKAEAKQAEGWGLEISLDIETAHAICQNCHIALVEAKSTSDSDLEAAESAAANLGATEISNSWGGPECVEVALCMPGTQAFNHPGIVITASAGDDGYLSWDASASAERGFASYPASSPDVVSIGGTRLELNSVSHAWKSETVWNDGGESAGVPDGHGAGGGGCSVVFTAQPWQQNVADWESVGCGTHRAVADVSADADPYTGLAVRYSEPTCRFEYEEESGEIKSVPNWCTIGGTSLASPLIASVYALAGGAGGVEYPAQTLYQNEKMRPAALHDISTGSNGKCSRPFDEVEEPFLTSCTPEQEAQTSCPRQLICLAHAGYDGPTGVGTPHGIEAFRPLSAPEVEQLNNLEAEEAEERAHVAARAAEEKAEEARTAKESSESQGSSGTSGSSAGPPAAASPATQTTPTPTPTATPTAVRISKLALTLKALLALNRSRPKLSQLGFTFTINVATRVSVSLAKRVRVHGHTRWALLHRAAAIAAIDGRNVRNLSGSGTLGAGAYRLTLTPSHGVGISLVFKLG
jgi:hypothetical protein